MAKVRGFEPRSQGFGDLHVTVTTHRQKWSGRQDSNLRPSGPKPDALPDCATPRYCIISKNLLQFVAFSLLGK